MFVVLDFGSQYTQLIARRLRELGVYSEILPFDVPLERLKALRPEGIILSGGPSSVYEEGAPQRDPQPLLQLAPVLGICYGMQLLAKTLGGQVVGSSHREYGLNSIHWGEHLVSEVPSHQMVWMSHGDVVEKVPPGFRLVARSQTGHAAAMVSERAWAFQFHPEVSHTVHGTDLLSAFVFRLCGASKTWNVPTIVQHLMDDIRTKVAGQEHILCALSGGVDSTVVGTLLTRALGRDRVHCFFVNNGLLRKNEFDEVLHLYERVGLNVQGIDATAKFLNELKDISDPEKKRKTIGRVFIEVFEDAVNHLPHVEWLAQGTLYPDVIESVSPRGTSVTIKSHHNVGGLPERMKLKLIEPLRELFKDEVRAVGRELGIPEDILGRHPFPGPGLAVRVLGPISGEALDVLRECDAIYMEELKRHHLYDKIWQAFSVLLPVRSVGVQGDSRSYGQVVALRAVTSQDGMTADWFDFPPAFLRQVSNRITNEVRAVNRVVYDVTSKPPGTIEWE